MIVEADILNGVIVEQELELTLAELCQACSVPAESLLGMVEQGILEPCGRGPRQWRFGGSSLRRAHTALQLQHDLGINLAGAALALDLMQEIDRLRERLRVLDGLE